MERVTIKQGAYILAQKEPFNAGNFYASRRCNEFGMFTEWLDVYSYGEMIATYNFELHSGAVFPEAYSHSVTTSKHANIVKRMWGLD
jgi:hypothetical protein